MVSVMPREFAYIPNSVMKALFILSALFCGMYLAIPADFRMEQLWSVNLAPAVTTNPDRQQITHPLKPPHVQESMNTRAVTTIQAAAAGNVEERIGEQKQASSTKSATLLSVNLPADGKTDQFGNYLLHNRSVGKFLDPDDEGRSQGAQSIGEYIDPDNLDLASSSPKLGNTKLGDYVEP